MDRPNENEVFPNFDLEKFKRDFYASFKNDRRTLEADAPLEWRSGSQSSLMLLGETIERLTLRFDTSTPPDIDEVRELLITTAIDEIERFFMDETITAKDVWNVLKNKEALRKLINDSLKNEYLTSARRMSQQRIYKRLGWPKPL